MNKFKSLVLALTLGLASVSAMAIDLKHGVVVSESEVPLLEMGVEYKGMTKAEYAQLVAVEAKFITTVERVATNSAKAIAKNSKNAGTYTMVLTGVVTEDDGKVNELAPMVLNQLTLKDVNSIMRANQTYMSSLIGKSEMNAVKGKKPWGNK